MEKTKRPLKKSILNWTVLFILVLCVVLSVVQYNSTKTMLYSQYEAYISGILNFVAADIDVDDLAQCIRTGVESEKYQALREELDKHKERLNLHYIYIIVPLNAEPFNNVKNVVAGASQEDYAYRSDSFITLNSLSGDAYTQESAGKYLEAYKSGELSFFEENTVWGDDYTGLLPLKDTKGNLVAAFCVDIDLAEIHAKLRSFTLEGIILIVMLGGLFVFSFYVWMERNVSSPIEDLTAGVVDFAAKCRDQKDPDALKISVPVPRAKNEVSTLSVAVAQLGDAIQEYARNTLDTEKELSRIIVQANKDSLTEVRNRKAYDSYVLNLQSKIDGKEDLSFALLMVNLNGLQKINESCGRDKGDLYIQKSCQVLCEVFSHSPVFRTGDDEFAVVLTGQDYTQRLSLLKWIRSAFQEMEQDESVPLWERCSVAIGMAEYQTGQTFEQIRNSALESLRQEKEALHGNA